MIKVSIFSLGLAVASAAALGGSQEAAAQASVYAYPLNGQSSEQQQRDRFECHQWAVTQSGFDPMVAPPAPSLDDEGGTASGNSSPGLLGIGGDKNLVGGKGDVVSDAATGAALGAIGGAVAGDAGTGAAIGAGAGTLLGAILRSSGESQQVRRRSPRSRHEARLDDYRRANRACLSGRGYEVALSRHRCGSTVSASAVCVAAPSARAFAALESSICIRQLAFAG